MEATNTQKIKHSRIGGLAIPVPAGVTVKIDGNTVTAKGPLGEASQTIYCNAVTIELKEGKLHLHCTSQEKADKSKHGLYRALVSNLVTGVTKGFTEKLIVNGVGYKCSVANKKLVMNIGYSHPVEIMSPDGITIACPTPTEIEVKGISKEAVGQCAAKIKACRPVEPYHAYGIRYFDEVVLRKEGKKAGK